MAHDRLNTTAEVAERLRLSPGTVRRWANAGRIPATRCGARYMRFDLEAVLAALAGKRGEVPHAAP
ncbi:MAG: helix-turn-helix domain-containing protein [Planctomycetes bacterium]|nr:helix-turn-helix domain-containing protein [Planctomycetota bacterium]